VKKNKTIPAAEFLYNSGLLFEINRLLLHPIGLALQVELDDNGKVRPLRNIQDFRDEPEGLIFPEEAVIAGQEKLATFMQTVKKPLTIREKMLGFVVQGESKTYTTQFVNLEQAVPTKISTTLVEPKVIMPESIPTTDHQDPEIKYLNIESLVADKIFSKTCTHDRVVSEKLTGGGSTIFCSSCGSTFLKKNSVED